jgi:type IV pilus assembly protein PilW
MKQDRGFSLLEMLISIVLVVMMLGGMYTVLFQTQGTFEAQQDVADLRQQARVTVQQIATELRMTGYDIGSVTDMLPAASATGVAFVADIDDGSANPPCGAAFEAAVDGGAERVTYNLQGNNLVRNVDCWDGGAWNNEYTNQVIADNVLAGTLFRYFDENGVELIPGAGGLLSAADLEAVRTIQISLALLDPDQQVFGDPQANYQAETTVRLRNAGL